MFMAIIIFVLVFVLWKCNYSELLNINIYLEMLTNVMYVRYPTGAICKGVLIYVKNMYLHLDLGSSPGGDMFIRKLLPGQGY